MAAGQITVELLMKTGSFETDTARAGKALKKLEADASKIGAALGVAAVAVGGALLAFAKNAIDSADALVDLSDATGASVENLSALESVANRNGQSLDQVTSILVKFNKALGDADGKNEVSRALQLIGVDVAELRRLDPAEALRQTAVALSRFADDGNKARIVQELFGKSIKEAGPFLKDLAEQQKLNATLTTEQAKAAEQFNKELFTLQANVSEAGRRLVTDMVPALNQIIEKSTSASGIIELLGTALKNMSRFPTFRPIVSLFETEKIGGGRGLVNPALVSPGDPNYSNEGRNRPTIGPLPPKPPKTPKAKADRDTEAERYLESLQKQIERTKELSFFDQALGEIQSGRLKGLTSDLQAYILAAAGELDLEKKLKAEEKERAEVADLMFRESKRLTEAAMSEADALADANKAYREETETLGLSRDAIYAIEQARISSAIAIKEEALAVEQAKGVCTELTDALERQIEALRIRKDLLGARQATEAFIEQTKKIKEEALALRDAFSTNFEDAFASFLDGSKTASEAFKSFANGVIADLARIQARKLAMQVFGDENGQGGVDWGSIASSIARWFGGGKAVGGPVSPNKAYMVGERGPEMFVPSGQGAIVPNNKLGGKTQNINVSVNATPGMSKQTAQQQGRDIGVGIRQALARND